MTDLPPRPTAWPRPRAACLPRSLLALGLSVALALPAHGAGPCVIAEPPPSDPSAPRTVPAEPRERPWPVDTRLQILDQFLSSPQALGRMVVIEGTPEAARAAAAARSALPAIDIAMARAEVGQTIRENTPTSRPPPSNPVLIRFMPAEENRFDAEAEAGCTPQTLRCSVQVFEPFWRSATPEQIAFTLAHELFHIAQTLAYPATEHRCTDWWGEGSAEWFANLAVPGRPYTARSGFLADFDRRSPVASLTNLEYEAVAFFFWAAERFGPGYPLTLGGFGDQGLGAARRLGTMLSPEDWASFAIAYLDGALRYPDGRRAIPNPNLGPVTAADGGVVMLTGDLLSLPRQRVRVEPGLWRFELTSIEPGSVVIASMEAGGWEVLHRSGESVARFFGCEGGGEIVIAVVGGAGDATGATFAIEREEGDCNSCVIGAWNHLVDRTMDPEEIDLASRTGIEWSNFLGGHSGFIRSIDATMRVQYRQTFPRLTLRPDGRFHYDDPRVLSLEALDEGGDPFSWMVTQHTHSVRGEWRDVRGRLMLRAGEVVAREFLRVESIHMSFSDFLNSERPAPIPFTNGMTIRCSARTLILEWPTGPGQPPIIHQFERTS